MKEIKLTQGKVALVDDEDFEKLNKFKWYARKSGKVYYARRNILRDRKIGNIFLHQMILEPRPGYETDHIDDNGLNNQRENLRYVTHQQNGINRRKSSGTSSRFKGVWWNKKIKKWMAMIRKEGVSFYLGIFINEEDAAFAYDYKAKELFGKFARINLN